MSKSRNQKARASAAKSSSGGKPKKASGPESGEVRRRLLADRPLSMKEFAERVAALQREHRSSVDSTKIIRAHRNGCCCELDECCFEKGTKRTAVSNLDRGNNPEEASVPESGDGWRWPPADRPLSMEEFAERAAALQREIRPSIDSTKIIRAHRDGCCCELDECCYNRDGGSKE